MRSNYNPGWDGITLVGIVLILMMAISVLADDEMTTAEAAVLAPAAPTEQPLVYEVIPPYEAYTLTQGPHGQSYGQQAIDLTAGKGAVIRSPIEGEVTALYVDDLGNTTLMIENDHYQVLLLHGDYEVQVGEDVMQGQPVGTESNHGYTIDAWGNLCAGRDCGYHTHLNIFDKNKQENVNPLEVLNAPGVE